MLFSGISYHRFVLVESEAQLFHDVLRPLQGLPGPSSTQYNEVIRIGYDPCPKRLAAPAYSPVLQKAIHVKIRHQGADNASLGGPELVLSPTRDFALTISILLLYRSLQPKFNQTQDITIYNPAGHTLHKVFVRNRIKILRQIRINDIRVALAQSLVNLLDRI